VGFSSDKSDPSLGSSRTVSLLGGRREEEDEEEEARAEEEEEDPFLPILLSP
jgi:hypothetical protein